jgi:hypothetical protein
MAVMTKKYYPLEFIRYERWRWWLRMITTDNFPHTTILRIYPLWEMAVIANVMRDGVDGEE